MRVASAISTMTRRSVIRPSSSTWPSSAQSSSVATKLRDQTTAHRRPRARTIAIQARSVQGLAKSSWALDGMAAGSARRCRGTRASSLPAGRKQQLKEPCPPDDREKPGARRCPARRQLDAELVAPGDEGAEEELVVEDDHDQHRQDRPADRGEVLLLDGERDVGADARQGDRRIADRDGLGGDDEEPPARHRHHRVPDEAGHGEGHFEAPETLPARKPEAARGLVEVARNGLQRLVEAEGHVPGLAREDREDRRELHAEYLARKQRHEPDNGEGEEAEHRHRLQDVEERDQHQLRPPALGGERAVDEGEDQRGDDCRQHPHGGAQRIFRQDRGIERDRRFAGGWSSGASVSRPPWRTRTKAPNTKAKARPSHAFGAKRGRTAARAGGCNAMDLLPGRR